jgi:glycosyltransferase involved in cell wall biosynthesis
MNNRNSIRVLHIGFGFTPWRGGGLIEYAEDIMKEQVKHGYEVYYFCSGRHYPFFRSTRLKRWYRNGYTIFEVINPPIYHGGDRGTIFDLECEEIEYLFKEVLEKIKPDLIHIQELAGLPSSLIDIAVSRKVPTIMTLQDYFLLCPTLKLFDYTNQNCLNFEDGKRCVICCKNISNNLLSLFKQTISYEFRRYKLYTPAKLFYKIFLRKIPFYLIKRIEKKDKGSKYLSYSLHDFFKLRREKNIERLKKIDLLIAQSKKVEKIYRHYLGLDESESKDKIITLHLTVKHVEKIVPKRLDKISYPIKFATLNGCASIPKGALLMLETIRILHNKGLSSYFEFHIFGGITKELKKEILQFNNTFYHGPYKLSELNEILENVDVGIVPSIWEEAYGFVGIEFLAKGIPVIGNNKGGIVDYTIDGFTGFVNYGNNAEGMANIIAKIISEPNIIKVLNGKIIENRSKLIKTIRQHFYELDKIYRDIINKGKNSD